MRRSRLSVHAIAVSAALLFAPELEGQGWVTLPNGELGFITTMTTTGLFTCGDPFFLIGSCQVSGRSITLGSGGAFMTLSFQGLTQSIMATNVTQPVFYGTVKKTFSGTGAFQFPTSTNINVPLFYFYMKVGLSGAIGPLWGTQKWGAGYLPLSRTSIPKSCCDDPDVLGYLPTTGSPAPYNYSSIVLHSFWGTTMTVTGEPINVYSNMAIVPEPATIWLTATGLVSVAAALRRRRKPSQLT